MEITENLSFNLGNTVKYLMRRQYKGRELEDLQKAAWYARRELKRVDEKRFTHPEMPGNLLGKALLVSSKDTNTDIGHAIGLVAFAAWSGDPSGSISAAVQIIEEEIRRVSDAA